MRAIAIFILALVVYTRGGQIVVSINEVASAINGLAAVERSNMFATMAITTRKTVTGPSGACASGGSFTEQPDRWVWTCP